MSELRALTNRVDHLFDWCFDGESDVQTSSPRQDITAQEMVYASKTNTVTAWRRTITVTEQAAALFTRASEATPCTYESGV
jgi:hypothetical protein